MREIFSFPQIGIRYLSAALLCFQYRLLSFQVYKDTVSYADEQLFSGGGYGSGLWISTRTARLSRAGVSAYWLRIRIYLSLQLFSILVWNSCEKSTIVLTSVIAGICQVDCVHMNPGSTWCNSCVCLSLTQYLWLDVNMSAEIYKMFSVRAGRRRPANDIGPRPCSGK